MSVQLDGALEEFFTSLGTSHQGLSPQDASRRLRESGLNRISERRPPPLVLRFGKHLVNRFALLLWAGAALSFVAERFQPGEGMETIGHALVAVVLLNACFTYWQESRAEHAMAAFRRMLTPRARVVRGGLESEVDAAELVPGDVVILREGDGVPADARLFEIHALKVNNASLTGESEPQLRSLEPTPENRHLVFSGTLVSAGSGKAVIYATGDRTELGRIAERTMVTGAASTPMHRELTYFINVISGIAVGLGIVFFALGTLLGNPFWGNLIFAIGIIVANVPEGLLPTVTLSLSLAAVRMSRREALVKNLESVETLGRTTVICTDKTGTLTSNTMRVHAIYCGRQSYTRMALPQELGKRMVQALVLCNNATINRSGDQVQTLGDPTEVALLLAAEELGASPVWMRQT